MSRLFEPDVVYPRDDTGCYIELEGEVIEVDDESLSELECVYEVKVRTEKGDFSGWTDGPPNIKPPAVGYRARIRIYNSGGGWYPDDKIVFWSAPDVPAT